MADSISINADGSWEFHGDDSRLKNSREDKQKTYRIWNALTKQFEYQTMDRVFCFSCGADGGLSARTAVYVKYLCDDCFKKYPADEFIPMTADEEYRWRMGLPDTD